MSVKVTVESVNPRWNDTETSTYPDIESAVDAVAKDIENEIEGADFCDDGTEEALRRKFIAKIRKPGCFAKLSVGKPKSFEYGVSDMEPVKATFELVS